MPHLRLNANNVSPNPYFNFISALPSSPNNLHIPVQETAKELLNALAAQVRPICKNHGFAVNSFEEYEHNSVFLGRNWNAGETIEIVLRRSDGQFHDTQQLIQVLCHELAHIKHMNHGAGFRQLNVQLCNEVGALRSKGYYGDGLYSSGSRLVDSTQVVGHGLSETRRDLPEYLCGGAQQRQRASTLRKKPRPSGLNVVPAKRRKPGTRVTSKYAFEGDGQTLNSHIIDETEKKRGTGFRKSTQSAKERKARLEAIEKRLQTSQRPEPVEANLLGNSSDSESDSFEETDESRRNLLSAAGEGWGFESVLGLRLKVDDSDIIDLVSGDESAGLKKVDPPACMTGSSKPSNHRPLLVNMVQEEIQSRKREKLGLVGQRRLDGIKALATKPDLSGNARIVEEGRPLTQGVAALNTGLSEEWACLECTCLNHNDRGRCLACDTRRVQ